MSKTIIDDDQAVMRFRCLRSERVNRGLRIGELALLTGLNAFTVANWEKGPHFPSPEMYNRLAQFFEWPKYRGQVGQVATQSHSDREKSDTREQRLRASASELYEALKTLLTLRAQPTLMEETEKARKLLARIDGERVSDE